MKIANQDIRNEIEASGLKKWHIADRLGIADTTFSVKLRHELSPEYKEKIRSIIAKLRAGE